MPVPKKRQGHARQATRRANWKAIKPTIALCPNCNAPRHPHTMCGVCGFYKDRVVLKALLDEEFTNPMVASDAAVEEAVVVEEPAAEKPAKKTTKKAKADDVTADADTAEAKPKKTTKKAAKADDAETPVDEAPVATEAAEEATDADA